MHTVGGFRLAHRTAAAPLAAARSLSAHCWSPDATLSGPSPPKRHQTGQNPIENQLVRRGV